MSYYDDCHVAMCQLHSGPWNRQEGILPLARAIPLHTVNNERKLSIWRGIFRQKYVLSLNSLCNWLVFTTFSFMVLFPSTSLGGTDIQKIGEECPAIKGNADIYGIGIRIAIYLQMVYTVLVQYLSPGNMAQVGPINIWFLFALAAVMYAQFGANSDMHPAHLVLVDILGSGLESLVLGPVIPEALAYENQFTSLSRVIVGGLWLGCSSNLWWSVYPRALYDTKECYPVGWGFVYAARALNTWEWYNLGRIFLPQLWTITITAHITRTRLDVKYIGGLVKGQVASQHTSHTKDFPSRIRIFLDCLFIFPSGDLKWLIYGVRVSLVPFASLHTNVYYACVGCAQ